MTAPHRRAAMEAAIDAFRRSSCHAELHELLTAILAADEAEDAFVSYGSEENLMRLESAVEDVRGAVEGYLGNQAHNLAIYMAQVKEAA